MTLTTLEFRVGDFTHTSVASSVDVYFHPVQMNTRAGSGWTWVYIDSPIRADDVESGLFTVELEDRQWYRLEILWHDDDRSRVGRSEWRGPFMVPSSGEDEAVNLARVLGQAPRNGMVRVLQSDPGASNFDQYVFNESTGDLFERRAG